MKKALNIFWLAVLSAGILSNPLMSYPGRDSGIFLYIGSLVLKGKIPYVDAWENKGPLIYYINALGLAFTGGSRWGIWLLEFLFIFVSGYLCYIILKKLMGEVAALLGTFVFVLTASNVLQGGNFSEEYSLLFSFIAIYFFLQDLINTKDTEVTKEKNLQPVWMNGFVIGATLGFNILLRPNNISVQVAIAGTYFLLTLFSKNWKLLLQRAVQIAGGMLAILIPVVLYFAAKGALTEMINVVLVFNSQYSEGEGLSRLIEGIVNAANSIGLLWIGLAFIGYILAGISLFKQKILNTPMGNFLLVMLIGLPIEAVLSTVSGKNYPHYFIGWSLYVGLLAGYVIYVFLNKFTLSLEKHSTRLVWLLILIAIVMRVDVWKNYGTAFSSLVTRHSSLDYHDPVADYIQKNTSPDEKVLVWGFRPIINFVAQRETPVTYLPYPLSHVDTPLAHRWADEYYQQLTSNPPVMIVNMIEDADRERIPDIDPNVRKQYKIKWKDVVLAFNYKDVLDFIQQNYVRVDTINGADIYRLKTNIP